MNNINENVNVNMQREINIKMNKEFNYNDIEHENNEINKLVRFNKNTTTTILNKVPYINIDAFNNFQRVKAVFSTRIGGISQGQFKSMNFCTHLGDSIENVRKNFEIFGEAASLNNFVLSKQTHTTNVRKVLKDDIGKGLVKPMDYDNVDGLITNIRNITLSTFYADCVPLYFYDPIHEAIGLSHSGWKGTVNNIARAVVDAMTSEYNTNPKELITAIGPSICVNCYEVSSDVASEFIRVYGQYLNIKNNDLSDVPWYRENIDSQDINNILYQKPDNKFMLNLYAANYINMLSAGVLPNNISIPDLCTCHNKELLFSHRGNMGKRGNLGAFMMLK
ncbi:MAG: peptidoglycan editing factor PgeF [Clostridiales bacterium]|nr:peptidoglycan editing factor PgeF [Clostridiales bacterium]